ncbi:B3 domain-containing protein REM5-like isoform X2 [Zingiber officinale]|uniref:B3 domain-containing protein REM5-like isoform X2 n=1 Tax=Zingiber officinale TaxID=94328 RepID=UPI001C4B0352|nr:B3 domain-containing protein REM5-like isoform X2 [Zingiber officinale]
MGSARVFFKVLLPGFLEKLSIPRIFVENLPETDRPLKVSIRSPLRTFWQVQIKREGCTLYFTDGWREFAEAHNFAVGFFLVFRYQGNMVFTVEVFGLNGGLKDYNHTGGCRCLSRGLVRSGYEEKQQLVVDEDDALVEEQEEDHIIVEDSPLQLPSGTEPPLQFQKKIRPYNLKYKIMGIPRHLASRSEFNTDQMFLLKNMRGRPWPVNYHQNGKNGFLRSGWDAFSKDNNLELGDRCIFKFISKGVMEVEVVKHRKYLLGY